MRTLAKDCWNGASQFVESFGRFQVFSFRVIPYLPGMLRRLRLVSEQLYFVGALSLVLIMFGGLFVGMVLAMQSYNTLAEFGLTGSLGAFAAEALVRELGPVVAALLFAGRAGASVASEVGLMRATQQIAALELMAIDPMQKIVAPRVLAGVISVPLLAAIFSAMGILGANFVATVLLAVDNGEFWEVFQTCIDEVKDPARQAFVLRVLEDKTTEEVCKLMDIKPNYLWVLLHRAREQLKVHLEAKWTGKDVK